ncbi:MAG: HNH endonuclease [Cystobacter sp.]
MSRARCRGEDCTTRCGCDPPRLHGRPAAADCPNNDSHVDHIIPKTKGGTGDPANGQVLCRDCNINKDDKDP